MTEKTADSFRRKMGEPTGEAGDLAVRYAVALQREHRLLLERRALTGHGDILIIGTQTDGRPG